MGAQTVRWTVTRRGVRDGVVHLSVDVSPRLVGGLDEQTLAAYPDWLDWPATPIAFHCRAGDGTELAVRPSGPPPRSDLWRTLFGPTTRVVSHGRGVNPLANRIIRPLRDRAPAQDEPEQGPPRLDFHTTLGALGEYPDLLRELGLRRDLAIDGDPDLATLRASWQPKTDTADVWHITAPATEPVRSAST